MEPPGQVDEGVARSERLVGEAGPDDDAKGGRAKQRKPRANHGSRKTKEKADHLLQSHGSSVSSQPDNDKEPLTAMQATTAPTEPAQSAARISVKTNSSGEAHGIKNLVAAEGQSGRVSAPRASNAAQQECWEAGKHADDPDATGLGVLLLSLGSLDLAQSRFDAFFRVYYKFHVPELKNVQVFKDDGEERLYYRPSDIEGHLPGKELDITNSAESECLTHDFYGEAETALVFHKYEDPENILTAERRYKGSFTHRYDVSHFPCDIQKLRLKFLMYPHDAHDYRRVWVGCKDVPSHDLEDLHQPDYHIDNLSQNNFELGEKTAEGYPTMSFTIVAIRNHGYHTITATMPMSMILLLTPASYKIDVEDIGGRLSVGLTLLLSTVAVKFVVAPDVPKVSYPTGLDIDTMISYGFLILVILQQVYFPEKDELASDIAHKCLPVLLAVIWRACAYSLFRYCKKWKRRLKHHAQGLASLK